MRQVLIQVCKAPKYMFCTLSTFYQRGKFISIWVILDEERERTNHGKDYKKEKKIEKHILIKIR